MPQDRQYRLQEEKTKLSWKDTYRAMVAEREDWSDLEATTADGVD